MKHNHVQPRPTTSLDSQVLANQAEDVPGIISKWGVKYPGEDLEAMAAIAKAAKVITCTLLTLLHVATRCYTLLHVVTRGHTWSHVVTCSYT